MSRASDELARLAAYVFQTIGRRRVPETEWVRLLSLDRKWFPPSQARRVLDQARTLGFVRNAGDSDLEIGLEAEGIGLPLDYRPDVEALESPGGALVPLAPAAAPPPLFRRLIRHLAQNLKTSESEVVGRINATQQAVGNLLTAEATALYFGALHGVDCSQFYQELEAALRA